MVANSGHGRRSNTELGDRKLLNGSALPHPDILFDREMGIPDTVSVKALLALVGGEIVEEEGEAIKPWQVDLYYPQLDAVEDFHARGSDTK